MSKTDTLVLCARDADAAAVRAEKMAAKYQSEPSIAAEWAEKAAAERRQAARFLRRAEMPQSA